MVTADELGTLLGRAGFRNERNLTKVGFYRAGDEWVILKLQTKRHPLVIHPRHEHQLPILRSLPGVSAATSYFHNADMNVFPERMHTGTRAIHYGFAFGFDSLQSASAFIDTLLDDDAAAHIGENASVGEVLATEREALAKSRLGQGQFRTALVTYWNGCAVTGCRQLSVLKASHIKPWRESSDSERLDPFNGLLLIPNIDTAFDRGFVTFTDSGRIAISECLTAETQTALGLDRDLRLSQIDLRHIPYLQHHRAQVFVNSAPAVTAGLPPEICTILSESSDGSR